MHHFRKSQNQKGFTMIELMVVVVIVGILAAIAIPLYGKYVKNAKTTEATGRIGEIITASKAWAQEHLDGDGDQLWPSATEFDDGEGVLDPRSTDNFDYKIAGGGKAETTNLVVTATGKEDMAGVLIVVTVPTVNSNGSPPDITGL